MTILIKPENSKKAFSLMELMAVIAIIGIMTAIAIVSLAPAKTATQLDAAVREVASTIKQAQSYALQGKVVNTNVVPCGFGIYFDDSDLTKYEIFYLDESPCEVFNTKSASDKKTAMDDRKHALESYFLKNGVKFDSALSGKKIYFTVPYGIIFDKNGGNITSLNIMLKALDGKTKSIVVGSGGNIEEQ